MIKTQKVVSFCNIVRVCLIPTRAEFNPMFSDIWYSMDEIESFKNDTYLEVKNFIEQNGCTLKEGMAALYQPD